MSKKHDKYQKVRLNPDVVRRVHSRLFTMPCRPSFTSYVNWMLECYLDEDDKYEPENHNGIATIKKQGAK